MGKIRAADRLFAGIEWRWSLATLLWGAPTAVASFALPAWAVGASKVFDGYSPLSWVCAGFSGLLAAALTYNITASGRAKWVRARYDARMLAQGGLIDPLERTFERKRIYLNEFCLPSHPLIEGKIFIECEIIGPANIIFLSGNNITDARLPKVDTFYMRHGANPNHGYVFKDCLFRGCNFSRISFMVQHEERGMFQNFGFVNWLTEPPVAQGELDFEADPLSNSDNN